MTGLQHRKIIITGASGTVGRALVPHLAARGDDLLLVGRNADALRRLFPDHKACNYLELAEAAKGYEACVHLAVKNNSEDGDLKEFRTANVAGLQHIFGDVQKAGISYFINLSSFHAANLKQDDPYAVSKREADAWLAQQTSDISILSLRLPAVYSESASGNLAMVNKLPKFLRGAALSFLGAFKPLISIENTISAIAESLEEQQSGGIAVANPAEKTPAFAITKKFIDWGFSLAIIALLWWLLAILFVTIRLTSPGPAIFAQERVGRHGKSFTCYKFRTMRTGTKQTGTHDVGADAITGIGAFLRRTKLDELPQVWNILRGELSLVGPRPCLPVQIELVTERTKRGVLSVLPGITGWAQINDIDMSDPVRLAKADADYVTRRTLPFELTIILRTFTGSGQGDRTAG